jgi:hypothetical protein
MSDHVVMFTVLSVIAAIGVFEVLAVRYGADSRRDERNLF